MSLRVVVYIYIYIYIHTYIHTYIHIHRYTHIHIHVCVCIYIYIYAYTYIYIYMYMCIYIYICMYIHIHIYIYICVVHLLQLEEHRLLAAAVHVRDGGAENDRGAAREGQDSLLHVHPVSITRFPLTRSSPGSGLLRTPFVHRSLRFSRVWVRKDGNLVMETGCTYMYRMLWCITLHGITL